MPLGVAFVEALVRLVTRKGRASDKSMSLTPNAFGVADRVLR